jgi:hypothetical protein
MGWRRPANRNVGPVCAEYAESVSFSIPGENPDRGQYLPDSDSQSPRLAEIKEDSASIFGILRPIEQGVRRDLRGIYSDKIRLCHFCFCLAQRQ